MSQKTPSINAQMFAIPDDEDEDVECSSSVSSYAGSAVTVGQSHFSAVDFLSEEFMSAFDPSCLDRSIAVQAQTSGMLHAKQQELEAAYKMAISRLEELHVEFANGVKYIRQTEKDLDYCQRKVQNLLKRTKEMYPVEYVRAREEVVGEE